MISPVDTEAPPLDPGVGRLPEPLSPIAPATAWVPLPGWPPFSVHLSLIGLRLGVAVGLGACGALALGMIPIGAGSTVQLRQFGGPAAAD